MKIQKFIYFSLVTILMGSCIAVKVTSDFEKEVDFNKYKTFQLLEHESDFPVGANPINRKRLEKAIRAKMTALNYQETDNPDLFVIFFVKKEIRQNSNAYRDYYDEYNYVEKLNVYQYKEGTLVIDLIDAKKKQIVWHGILTRPTDENLKTAEKRINRNVEKIFERFAKQAGR